MKLPSSLLLPALVGAAFAASDATVYLFQGREWPNSSNPPSLSVEQARLVFAQRLGVSQYHTLSGGNEDAVFYINQFGGRRDSLFQDAARDKAAELVLVLESVSPKTAEPLLNAWSPFKPAFTITNPPSWMANTKFVSDLRQQLGSQEKVGDEDLESAINPLDTTGWNGRSKIIHFDIISKKVDELLALQQKLLRYAEDEEMNVMIVLMPESTASTPNSWGSYGKADQQPLKARRVAEETLSESPAILSSTMYYNKQVKSTNTSTNNISKPIRGVLPACFPSRDECRTLTNDCSGRGECYKKYSNVDSKGGCFTCGCRNTNMTFSHDDKKYFRTVSWGGSACQKEDISSAFWLIALFSVVAVATVSWGIGMMFSIGEEKLPGVIGAGVPSSRAK